MLNPFRLGEGLLPGRRPRSEPVREPPHTGVTHPWERKPDGGAGDKPLPQAHTRYPTGALALCISLEGFTTGAHTAYRTFGERNSAKNAIEYNSSC